MLSPSYTKWFSSSIDLVAWPLQREDSREEFQNKDVTKKSKSQTVTWEKIEKSKQYSSINLLGGFIESIS